MKKSKIRLKGNILAKARIGIKNMPLDKIKIINVPVELNGVYHYDWQYDAYHWHDEGFAEYDIKTCKPCNKKIFEIVGNGEFIQNKSYIIKEIFEIFDEYLEII